MNKLSKAIESVKQQCLETGSGNITFDNQVKIQADWEELERDSNFEVVAIYIFQHGFLKFRHQLEETKKEVVL